MKTLNRCNLKQTAAIALVVAAGGLNAEEPGATSELSDVTLTTCAEVAEIPEMDRAFSLIFYYGYLAGRSGISVIDPELVPRHLELVRDYCNANPDATVIQSFTQALSSSE